MKKFFTMLGMLYSCLAAAQAPYPSAPPLPSNINRVEFYIDTLTTFSAGTLIAANTGFSDFSNFNTNAFFGTTLTPGGHRIYFRSMDANGVWSLSSHRYFDNFVVPLYATAPPASATIKRVEFFVDILTPFAASTLIAANTGAIDFANFNTNSSFGGTLTSGGHRIYYRSMDSNGVWSLSNNKFFHNFIVQPYNLAAPPAMPITKCEYFFDNNDVGFGACNPIVIAPGVNIVGQNANIDISALQKGAHRLWIRTMDSSGLWSITNFAVFDNALAIPYPTAPSAAPAIAQFEYFIDTDPGFGQATSVTAPGNGGNVVSYAINVNVSGLSNGPHRLYIRSKQNPWSLTNTMPFNVGAALPLDWLYVKASLQSSDAIIEWGMPKDEEVAYFEIEKSVDGSHFETLSTVVALHNAADEFYSYTNKNIGNGFSYYRIKKVNHNGEFLYSHIMTLFKPFAQAEILLAPNPVTNVINIALPQEQVVTAITLYSVDGKVVYRKHLANAIQYYQIPTQSVPRGQYMLQISTEDAVVTKQVILQ